MKLSWPLRSTGDYAFIQKAFHFMGVAGFIGHLVFYLVLHFGVGYWESFPLRLSIALGHATLFFYPREGALSFREKAWFEFLAASVFPAFFTVMLLMNGGNVYWFASLVFCGLLHGLVSSATVMPWSYPLAAGLATWLFHLRHPDAGELHVTNFLAHFVTYFLALVTVGIKTAMEKTHEKIVSTRLALSKAEDELVRAKETRKAYEELKKREELIRVFVRPSLVEEIQSGRDPSAFEPVLRDLAILFCDIRDFTTLTEVLSAHERQAFLNRYFALMTHPIVENGGEVDKIMGDCVMGIFPDGDRAARAAIDMRLRLQAFNGERFRDGQSKIRNGIGIAKGEVMLANFGSFDKLDRTVIGEAVNIASRLESKTKLYNLDVVVTEDVIRDLGPDPAHCRWIDNVQVKGSSRHLRLYEVYGHQPVEVRRYKDESRGELEKALKIYFRKDFREARSRFQDMLDRVPPHRLVPHELMDGILRYYLDHCDAWIGEGDRNPESVESWTGVHVFHEK